MAVARAGANPFAREEWSLGMALRDYFDVPLKEIAQELLTIRELPSHEALAYLESLKVMLSLEGYNILPMQKDRLQQPTVHRSNYPVVVYSGVKADSDGPNYSKDENLEPLPPQVGFCNDSGYCVGAVHPAS